MYTSAIVLAAGKGLRLKSGISKLLLRINSQPLIIYSLQTLSHNRLIKEIIVAANPSNIQAIAGEIRRYRISKVKNIVLGGKRRQDSVYSGLSAVSLSADLVLIHDAARPFVEKQKVSQLIKQTAKDGACILAVPVKATIKKARSQKPEARNKKSPFIPPFKRGEIRGDLQAKDKNKFLLTVDKTLNRDNLWEVQTPQVFRKDLIIEAYNKFRDLDVTDDASLVEKLGARVSVLLGSYNNIKVTTPEDLMLAQAIVKNLNIKESKLHLKIKNSKH